MFWIPSIRHLSIQYASKELASCRSPAKTDLVIYRLEAFSKQCIHLVMRTLNHLLAVTTRT